MPSHNTSNTQAFIEAQQYSSFILANLSDGLLPDTFTRDVSDFGSGTTLNIKTIGAATIQEVFEEQALAYNAIDTGTVTLQITDYVGDAWSVSDVLRQDGSQVEALSAARARESTRALQEYFETRFLATANAAQTATSVNAVNGFAHRWVADAAADNTYKTGLDDFRKMKLSFDKANVSMSGRIAIVDPVVEATLNGLYTSTWVSNNPRFEGIITEGFARDHKFVANIFGWDIYTSNRLPILAASEAIDASSYGGTSETAPAGSVVNLFMCVDSDQSKPIMRAWRQMPKAEGRRNFELKRDEFDVTARLGFGAQRVDTLGAVITSATNY